MDHAINQLREYMRATISVNEGMAATEVRDEIKTYVDALNVMEKHYYGEERTNLEEILVTYFK